MTEDHPILYVQVLSPLGNMVHELATDEQIAQHPIVREAVARAEKAEDELSKAKAALGVAVRTIGRLAEDVLSDEVDAALSDDPPKGGEE